MTPTEARAVLGVEPDIEPKALRRAYLRRLKGHRPDDDPEAFMRLREAFELLSGSVQGPPGPWVEPTPEVVPPLERAVCVDLDRDLRGRLEVCREALEVGAVGEATEGAITLLALSRHQGFVEPWLPAEVMVLILGLHRAGAVTDAFRVHDALAEWFGATGAMLRCLLGFLAVRWSLLVELRALPADLLPPLRSQLARACLTWDWADGWGDLAELVLTQPQRVLEAGSILFSRAPLLGDLSEPLHTMIDWRYGVGLGDGSEGGSPSEAPEDLGPETRRRFAWILGISLLITLVCSGVGRCLSTRGYPSGEAVLSIRSERWTQAGLSKSDERRVAAEYWKVCLQPEVVGRHYLTCDAAKRGVVAALEGRCDEAREAIGGIDGRDASIGGLVQQLSLVLQLRCPEPTP